MSYITTEEGWAVYITGRGFSEAHFLAAYEPSGAHAFSPRVADAIIFQSEEEAMQALRRLRVLEAARLADGAIMEVQHFTSKTLTDKGSS